MDDYKKKRILSKLILKNNVGWWLLNHIRTDCRKYKIKSLYSYCKENQCITEMLDDRTKRYCTRPAKNEEEYEVWNQKELNKEIESLAAARWTNDKLLCDNYRKRKNKED